MKLFGAWFRAPRSWFTYVGLIFVSYAGFLTYISWPIKRLNLSNASAFGDSFGLLSALFTALAFVGLLVTISYQRKDLALTRRELRETKEEFKLQSKTFARENFENSFYNLLSLYRINLDGLSIRPESTSSERLHGITAISFLNKRFDKAWTKKRPFLRFPDSEDDQVLFIASLISTINSVFQRQSRYVDTLESLALMVQRELPETDHEIYYSIINAQLTYYEMQYLLYQALVDTSLPCIRKMFSESTHFQTKIETLTVPNSHRSAFKFLWDQELPSKNMRYRNPLSPSQNTQAKKLARDKRKEG